MDPNIRPYSYFVLKNAESARGIDLLDYTVLFGSILGYEFGKITEGKKTS
ncbi:hypothetical protein HOD38_05120 [archaeon]|jgi:hypothetical protein|nr:hypothetical protein [archaeon]MBT4397621.1 hypothetical protein [archaeon]MBT4441080.1 hypothetical protein [archaeon]